jgi:uncharacterized membrane protein
MRPGSHLGPALVAGPFPQEPGGTRPSWNPRDGEAFRAKAERIMSDLVVIAYPSAEATFAARAEFVALQREYLVEMEDVVVVTRSEAGDVHSTKRSHDAAGPCRARSGAASSASCSSTPPRRGRGRGLGSRRGALTDLGIDDAFLRATGASWTAAGAALAISCARSPPNAWTDRRAPWRDPDQTSLPAARRTSRCRARASEAPYRRAPPGPRGARRACAGPAVCSRASCDFGRH